MAESVVQVTEGSGKKLHTWSRTVGANTVEDELVLPGEYPYATYTINAANISTATANAHLLQIMAGAALAVRIRRIEIEQAGNATTVGIDTFALVRLSTAGTGGAAVTPNRHDTADAAAGCTAMTLPTVKGTEGVEIRRSTVILRQGSSATTSNPEETILWQPNHNAKPYIIPAGAANGFCIKNLTAIAGASVNITVELVEVNYA